MSKYDYKKFGYSSYELYVSRTQEEISKEDYEAELDKKCEHYLHVLMRNHMLDTLKEKSGDVELMMEVYSMIAPILGLDSEQEMLDKVYTLGLTKGFRKLRTKKEEK